MRLLDTILDALYPPKCVFCQTLLDKDEKPDGICRRCTEKVTAVSFDNQLHGEFFDMGWACFKYENEVRHSIHRFKFGGRKEYALIYARYIKDLADMMEMTGGCSFITSVPTNKKNLRKRGYDHNLILAREVSKALGLPYVRTLSKTRETRPMFDLKAEERRANILGSMTFSGDREQIKGKKVLLIDDIFTTGATAGECSRTLKMAGAAKVYLLTVAKTEKKP